MIGMMSDDLTKFQRWATGNLVENRPFITAASVQCRLPQGAYKMFHTTDPLPGVEHRNSYTP